jgi:hypothetical protein
MTRPRLTPRAWPAAAAAPLVLLGLTAAGASAVPAAVTHPAGSPAAAPGAARPAAADEGPQQLQLPGLRSASYTVTLITGDRVTLTQAAPGRYTATATPAVASSPIDIRAQGGPAGLTTLTAVPADAQALITSGQVNPGLFDLRYLAAHGGTGTAASIPVTIQYPAATTAAQLRRNASQLPGATIQATNPASGEVTALVAARNAAAFWAALTRTGPGTPATGNPGEAGLAGGASRIWLTGHQITASATPRPQDSPPLYQVTETITKDTGTAIFSGGQGTYLFLIATFLWGVAGPGKEQAYLPTGTACASLKPAKPLPVCTAWAVTYSVPAGVYFAQGDGQFNSADNADHTLEEADLELDVPQFTVTGPTALTLNADTAVPVTASTPLPAVEYTGPGAAPMDSTRSLPDGSYSASVLLGGSGYWWAIPTPPSERATIGSYHYAPELTLGRQQLTAAVTSPGHLTLHPLYPCGSYQGATQSPDPCSSPRFTSRQTLQLVDAGQGTASDFSKINAHGKLALIQLQESGDIFLEPEQLVNAQQAGAAGVLFDVSSSPAGPNTVPDPVSPTASDIPPIPVTEIDSAEAGELRGLLANGPVTITLRDLGVTPYLYFLLPDQEGGIASSLHFTYTGKQLAETSVAYHSPSPPADMEQVEAPFRPDDWFIGADTAVIYRPQPFRVSEYYGPLSPDLAWQLDPGCAELCPYAGQTMRVFDQPTRSSLDLFSPPLAPGAFAPWTGVDQAQPDKFPNPCAACRQGNTFWPVFYLVSGASPDVIQFLYAFTPDDDIHLYDQAGQEITATPVDGLVTYQLPPQQGRYRLVTQYGSTSAYNGASTTWDFTSSEPASNQAPEGTWCVAVTTSSTEPCRADPLVFLRYDAGLSLADTVTGPGVHQLQVTGYHQDPSAPPVTSLKLWTSTNGGSTWQQATVTGGHDGTFTATYTLPAASATNGYVTIKAQASDAAGNDITQTIPDAYGIAAATAAGSHGK